MPEHEWNALLQWVKSAGTDGWRKYKKKLEYAYWAVRPLPSSIESANLLQDVNTMLQNELVQMYKTTTNNAVQDVLMRGGLSDAAADAAAKPPVSITVRKGKP
jgi:hypothetical protein